MALGNDKMRILVNLPIDLKIKVEKLAKTENRSVSNYVVTLLQREVQRNEQEKKINI